MKHSHSTPGIFWMLFFIVVFSQPAKSQQKDNLNFVPVDKIVVLSSDQKVIFQDLALKKIKEFQFHLSEIASTGKTLVEKMIFKETALKNFINNGNGVTMEISALVGDVEKKYQKSLIDYLESLCRLKYAKVGFKSAKTCYVSNLEKDGYDANGYSIYKATATYFQEFTGYDGEGRAVYHDITQKTVEVQVRFSSDIDHPRWVVYLGDISVAETNV